MNRHFLQYVYAIFAVIGLCATWYWNIQFMQAQGGFSSVLFVTQNYLNAASASISNDLLVAFATFLVWSFAETRRLSMRGWWIYAVLGFGIAFAFALPLFLCMRERRLAVISV